MASKEMKQILDHIAKISSKVMTSADKAVPTCPTCGMPSKQQDEVPVPVEQPEDDK